MSLKVLGAALLGWALFSAPANAAVFNFSFSGADGNGTVSGSGTITATGSGPTYSVQSVTGTVNDSDAGLPATSFAIDPSSMSPYAGSDNILYYPSQAPSNTGYVDFGGVSFTADAGAIAFNLGGESQSGPIVYVLNDSILNPVGYPNQTGSTIISLNVSAVPEPATWAMMLLGFAGVGFLAYRRNSKPALAMV